MKIVYHHRTRAEDAQGIHIEEIQRALAQLGHEVREVALIPRGGAARKKAKPSAAARTISAVAKVMPRGGVELLELAGNVPEAMRIAAAVRAMGADAIYERYSLHNAAGVLASRWTGVPLVLEVNAPLAAERAEHGGLTFESLARRIESAIWKAATAIVTVSGPLKAAIVAAGVDPSRVLVQHNAVRREATEGERDGAPVRRKYGIEFDQVVCGFTGWFRPWHGLERFLECFADAGLASIGARVMLVGDGQARPALERIVSDRGLGKAVIFTGPVGRDEIDDVVAAFDLALQPAATPYASPMKIFEYLAQSKPVVAAATPAIAEVLTHGKDSLLFAPGNWPAMTGAVKRLVEAPQLRQKLSRGAKQTIVERGLFWDENARRTMEHLARCAIRSAQPAIVDAEAAEHS